MVGLLSGLFILPSLAQQPYNPNRSAGSYNQSWISIALRGSNSLNQNVYVRLSSSASPVLTARTPLHYLGGFRIRPGQPVSISGKSGNGFRVICGTIPANAHKVTITAYKQGSIYRCGMQINQ